MLRDTLSGRGWLRAAAVALLVSGCPRPGLPPLETETECEPGLDESCYSGPADTGDVGACKVGTRVCDEAGQWGACEGEVLPQEEVCAPANTEPVDRDCDGEPAVECAETPVLVVLSNAGLDLGQSVLATGKDHILWAGRRGPSGDESDGFLQELELDGTLRWSNDALTGAGAQSLAQVVVGTGADGEAKVFAGGAVESSGGTDSDGLVFRVSEGGLSEELSGIASPGNDVVNSLVAAGASEGVWAAGSVGGVAKVPEGAGATFGDADDLFVMRVLGDGFVPWNMVAFGQGGPSIARALAHEPATGKLFLGITLRGILSVPSQPPNELALFGGDPSDGLVYVIDPEAADADPVTAYFQLRSSGADEIEALATEADGSFYVVGWYSGAELKLSGTALLAGDPDGLAEGFIARIDKDGQKVWATRFGGPGNQRLKAVALSGDTLVVAGVMDQTGTFDTTQAPHAGGVDFVVARLERATGEVMWLRSSEGDGDEWASAVALDAKGGTWVTGDFSADLRFVGVTATANGDFDAFLVRIPPM